MNWHFAHLQFVFELRVSRIRVRKRGHEMHHLEATKEVSVVCCEIWDVVAGENSRG